MTEAHRRNIQAAAAKSAVRGTSHYMAVLTEAQVVQARKLFYSGQRTIIDLAAEMGCKSATLGAAVRGANWKHLPMPTLESQLRELDRRERPTALYSA